MIQSNKATPQKPAISTKPLLWQSTFLAMLIGFTVSSGPGFPLYSQNLPDRATVLDPLGDTTVSDSGFVLLPGARLFGEFGRYTNGSGENHRWNAKTGGYLEFARWDSSWSVSVFGTMEVVMDPLNDIEFNPRAIFWEEGIVIARRPPWTEGAIHVGYDHRCKHDIDNYEVYNSRGEIEQRTLIYSGPFVRLLARPRPVVSVAEGIEFNVGASLRFDYFVHLFDERWDGARKFEQRSFEDLRGSINGALRLELRKRGGPYGIHLGAGGMASLFSTPDQLPTDVDVKSNLATSIPFVEAGIDLFNPTGMTFSLFARKEWQDDGGILSSPTAANLLLIGVRGSSSGSIW